MTEANLRKLQKLYEEVHRLGVMHNQKYSKFIQMLDDRYGEDCIGKSNNSARIKDALIGLIYMSFNDFISGLKGDKPWPAIQNIPNGKQYK